MDIKSKVNSFFLQIGDTYSVRVRTEPITSPSPPSYPLILIHHTDSKGHKQDKSNYFLCPLMESGVFPFPSNWCLRRIDGTYRQSQLSWD